MKKYVKEGIILGKKKNKKLKKYKNEYEIELSRSQYQSDLARFYSWKMQNKQGDFTDVLSFFIFLLDNSSKNDDYISKHAAELISSIQLMQVLDDAFMQDTDISAPVPDAVIKRYKKMRENEKTEKTWIISFGEIYRRIRKKIIRSDEDTFAKNLFYYAKCAAEEDDTWSLINNELIDSIETLYKRYETDLRGFHVPVQKPPTMRNTLSRLLLRDPWIYAILPVILTSNAVSMAIDGTKASKAHLIGYPKFKRRNLTVYQLKMIRSLTKNLFNDIKLEILDKSSKLYCAIGYPKTETYYEYAARESRQYWWEDEELEDDTALDEEDKIILDNTKAFVIPVLRDGALKEIEQKIGKKQTENLTIENVAAMIYRPVLAKESPAICGNTPAMNIVKAMREFVCPEFYFTGMKKATEQTEKTIQDALKKRDVDMSFLINTFSYESIANIFMCLLAPIPMYNSSHKLPQLSRWYDFILEDLQSELYKKYQMQDSNQTGEIIVAYQKRDRRTIKDNLTVDLASAFLTSVIAHKAVCGDDRKKFQKKISHPLKENSALWNLQMQRTSEQLWISWYNQMLEISLNMILEEVYLMYQLAFLHHNKICNYK